MRVGYLAIFAAVVVGLLFAPERPQANPASPFDEVVVVAEEGAGFQPQPETRYLTEAEVRAIAKEEAEKVACRCTTNPSKTVASKPAVTNHGSAGVATYAAPRVVYQSQPGTTYRQTTGPFRARTTYGGSCRIVNGRMVCR